MTIVGVLLSRWEFYLSIFVLLIISRLIKWLKDPLRKIPGPRGYPIIGNTFDYSYRNDLLKVLLERYRKYGTVYKEWGYFGRCPRYLKKEDVFLQLYVSCIEFSLPLLRFQSRVQAKMSFSYYHYWSVFYNRKTCD